MENIREVLANNVRRLRKQKRWNQIDLAEASGISLGGIQKIESGAHMPRPPTIAAIAGALAVKEAELFEGFKTSGAPSKQMVSDISADELIEKIRSSVNQSQAPQLSPQEDRLIKVIRTLHPMVTEKLALFLTTTPEIVMSVIGLRNLIQSKFLQESAPKHRPHNEHKKERKVR